MRFGTWLGDVRAEEREAGVNHRELACHPSRLTEHVQDRLSRALHQMEKTYIQIPPAPLDEARLRERWEGFRERYVRDLREALDHIAAALTAVGCTEEELEAALCPAAGDGPETGESAGEEAAVNANPEGAVVNETTAVLSLREVLATVGDDSEK